MIDIRELRSNPEAYPGQTGPQGRRRTRSGTARLGRGMARDNDIGGVAARETEVFREADRGATGGTAAAKEHFQETESKLAELEARRRALLDRLPNPPADDVPSGGEEDFEVLREMGTKPSFAFTARDDLDLAQPHGWLDAPRGYKGLRIAVRLSPGRLGVAGDGALPVCVHARDRAGSHPDAPRPC